MKKHNAKWVYRHGKSQDFTDDNIIEIVQNLYAKGLAEAWFIGMGWPEGYHYCQNLDYLRNTFCHMERQTRAIWFACTFLN